MLAGNKALLSLEESLPLFCRVLGYQRLFRGWCLKRKGHKMANLLSNEKDVRVAIIYAGLNFPENQKPKNCKGYHIIFTLRCGDCSRKKENLEACVPKPIHRAYYGLYRLCCQNIP